MSSFTFKFTAGIRFHTGSLYLCISGTEHTGHSSGQGALDQDRADQGEPQPCQLIETSLLSQGVKACEDRMLWNHQKSFKVLITERRLITGHSFQTNILGEFPRAAAGPAGQSHTPCTSWLVWNQSKVQFSPAPSHPNITTEFGMLHLHFFK